MSKFQHAMSTQSDDQLLRAVRALNADLVRHFDSDQPSTQAHVGMIELARAAADELERRGYRAGAKADGSDLPVDVQWEDGQVKLSFAVRVF